MSSESTDLNANDRTGSCTELTLSLTALNDVCQARYIILTERHIDKPFRHCQTKDINLERGKKSDSGGKWRAMIIDTAGFFFNKFQGNEGREINSD